MVEATELLPGPTGGGDLMADLAMMMIQQKHEDRVVNDAQSQAATKSQQEAQARKIAEMHELADDTFKDGLVEGIGDCVAAGMTAGAAALRFDGEMKGIQKETLDPNDAATAAKGIALDRSSKVLLRDASFLDAGSKAVAGVDRFGTAATKREIELDRADMAVADADIDRAKAAAESASTNSRRDQDDIKEVLNAYRSYAAAQTQLGQAALFRA